MDNLESSKFNYYLIVLKKYVEFNGRARRSEYWYFVLFNFIIAVVIGLLDGLIHSNILSRLYSLAVMIPGIAVSIRRVHDVNKSGWYLLIPFYNLVLVCTKGDTGVNQYGADPKNPALLDEVDEIGNN